MHSPIFNCALVDNLVLTSTFSYLAGSFITINYDHIVHAYSSHARKYIIFEYACMLIRHMLVHIYACTYIHRMYILGEHAAHHLPKLLRLLTQTHT